MRPIKENFTSSPKAVSRAHVASKLGEDDPVTDKRRDIVSLSFHEVEERAGEAQRF